MSAYSIVSASNGQTAQQFISIANGSSDEQKSAALKPAKVVERTLRINGRGRATPMGRITPLKSGSGRQTPMQQPQSKEVGNGSSLDRMIPSRGVVDRIRGNHPHGQSLPAATPKPDNQQLLDSEADAQLLEKQMAAKRSYNDALARTLLGCSSEKAAQKESLLHLHGQKEKAQDIPLTDRLLSCTRRSLPRYFTRHLDALEIRPNWHSRLIDCSNPYFGIALNAHAYVQCRATSNVVEIDPEIAASDYISSVAFGNNGSLFAIGTHQGNLQYWDVTSEGCKRRCISSLKDGVNGTATKMALCSFDENQMAIGSFSGSIYHTDLRAREEVVVKSYSSKQGVYSLTHNNHGIIAAGYKNGSCSITDIRAASKQVIVRTHQTAVRGLAFLDRTHLVTAGAGEDRQVKIWNIQKCDKPIAAIDMQAPVYSCSYSNSSKILAVGRGGAHNDLVLFNMPSPFTNLHKTEISKIPGGFVNEAPYVDPVVDTVISPDGTALYATVPDAQLLCIIDKLPPYESKKADKREEESPLDMSNLLR